MARRTHDHVHGCRDDRENEPRDLGEDGRNGHEARAHGVHRRGAGARRRQRHADDEEAWDKPRHPNLASGYAAIWTIISSIGLIVVCMSQEWWTGPVANAGTGDIAMIVSFAYSVVMYTISRSLELRWKRRS